MGMYTAFHFHVELRKATPSSVVRTLGWLRKGVGPIDPPDHPLFSTERYEQLLTSDSYYFDLRAWSDLWHNETTGTYFLNAQSSLKNYHNEIDKFVDWLAPHIYGEPGQYIGYQWYEENDQPTPIFLPAIGGGQDG